MPSYTEEELIIALKTRDSEAFAYLYKQYRGALFAIILQFIPDKEAAGDVLQEVFINIWKSVDKYDPAKGRLFTWLLTLTRNMAINTTRSKQYKSELKNDDISLYVNSIDAKEDSVQAINFIGLRTQVHQLRADYKNVLELSYYNGFTQQEIADLLNIPIGTVKTRLRNAIIELRKQFV